MVDVLPSMILLGIGAGMAFNPVLLAAMGDVPQEEAGLASGVVNTAFMMGGALGLAVLASLAASRTDSLTARAAASSPRSRAATTLRSSWARSSRRARRRSASSSCGPRLSAAMHGETAEDETVAEAA